MDKDIDQYIIDYEGLPPEDPIDNLTQPVQDISLDDKPQKTTYASFFTTGADSYDVFRKALTTELANRAAKHALNALSEIQHSNSSIFNLPREVKSTDQSEACILTPAYQIMETYLSAHQYSETQFQGILIDSSTAQFSTAGYS
jgi:hypothetical protein